MTITQQKLESGAIKHTGWTRDGREANQDADDCGVNVIDYFDLDGKYLGPDENGLEPTFEACDLTQEIGRTIGRDVIADGIDHQEFKEAAVFGSPLTTDDVFRGKNCEIAYNGNYVLLDPTGPDQTYEIFDELAADHPVCEEARQWAEGNEEN